MMLKWIWGFALLL